MPVSAHQLAPTSGKYIWLLVLALIVLMCPDMSPARESGLASFRGSLPAPLYGTIRNEGEKRSPAIIRFRWRSLCAANTRSFAARLNRINTTLYSRANAFAEKMQQCPGHCRPAVNEGQYCDYVRGREREIGLLNRWDKGFFSAYNLLSEAEKRGRTPEEELLAFFRLRLDGAIGQLASPGEQTTERTLIDRELAEMHLMLQVLTAQRILTGDVKPLLAAFSSVMDVQKELLDGGGKIPAVEKRMRAATALVWIERSLAASVRAYGRASRPVTTAAHPAATAPDQMVWKQAAKCFRRLSLDAATAAGGVQSELELLNSCRDAPGECGTAGVSSASRPISIARFEEVVGWSFKDQYAVTGSMCRKRRP